MKSINLLELAWILETVSVLGDVVNRYGIKVNIQHQYEVVVCTPMNLFLELLLQVLSPTCGLRKPIATFLSFTLQVITMLFTFPSTCWI